MRVQKHIGLVKTFIFVICILSLMTSCQNDGPVEGDDNQMSYHASGLSWQIAESDHFYYHIAGSFLYSIAKDDGEVRVVDNNPDTLDDAEPNEQRRSESNGFFFEPRYVYYSNQKLYVLASVMVERTDETEYIDCLFEVDPSGRGQKEIYRAQTHIYDAFIHRGYFYFSTSDAWNLQEEIEKGELTDEEIAALHYQIERIPLNNPKQEPELVFQKSGIQGVAMDMCAYDNYLYFKDSIRTSDANKEPIRMICHLENLSTIPLESNQTRHSSFAFIGDHLLHIETPINNVNALDKKESYDTQLSYLVTSDFDGTQRSTTNIPDPEPLNILGWFYGYDDILCLDNYLQAFLDPTKDRCLQLCNTKGELLTTVEVPARYSMIMGMTSEYLFIEAQPENSTSNYMEIYRLDLKKAVNGDAHFEPFFIYQPQIF